MLLSGMKVYSIRPGAVFFDEETLSYGWSIVVNGEAVREPIHRMKTCGAAKQAMREEVARLRKIHLPE